MDLIHTIYYGIVIVPLCFQPVCVSGYIELCYFSLFRQRSKLSNSCGGVFCSILPIRLHIYTSYYCNCGCVQMARNRGMMVIHGHCSSFRLVFVICSLVVVFIIIIVKFCEPNTCFFLFISSSIHKIMK